MTAFGPFAQTERIAFDSLGRNPLFLINGPTGSGKTTILDAICFALYGKTTGDERQASQMRCDHAPPDSIAKVELMFELLGRRYRIIREPEQLRPKLRGEGFTRHAAKAELYRVEDSGEETLMVAAKVTEATSAIEDMTGLSVEQFRQVMVLPQGEFRKLLIADSNDRQKVFSQLFQTHIYKRIEYALKDQSAELRKQLEALHNQQKGILDSADVNSEEDLTEELLQQNSCLEAALVVKKDAQKRYEKQNNAVQAATKILADFDRLAKHQKELTELLDQSTRVDQQRLELSLANQALKIHSDYQQLLKNQQTLKQAEASLADHRLEAANSEKALTTSQQAFQRANDKLPEIEAAKTRQITLNSYQARLEALKLAAMRLSEKKLHAQRKQAEVKQQREAMVLLDEELLTAKQLQQSTMVNLKALNDHQTDLVLQQQQLNRRQELHNAELKLAEYQQQSITLASELEQSNTALSECILAEQRLELNWHQAQAAILAQQLEADTPCLVCGSKDHPQPAVAAHTIPDQLQRDNAKQAIEAARKAQQLIQNQVSELTVNQQHIITLVTRLNEELGPLASQPITQLQQQVAELQRQQSELEVLQSTEKQQVAAVDQLTNQRLELVTTLTSLEEQFAELNTEQQVALNAMQTAEAEIPAEFHQDGALSKAVESCAKQLNVLEKALTSASVDLDKAKLTRESSAAHLKNAEVAFTQAQQLVTDSSSLWMRCIDSSEFDDQQAFQLALRSDDQIRLLQQRLEDYDRMLATAQGAVKSLQLLLGDAQPPEIETLTEQLEQAKQQLISAEQNYNVVDKRVSELKRVQQKLQLAKQQALSLEDEYAIVGTLSDVASGKTDNRISLERFVLSVLLDDVLVEASQRLKRMSKGRYELYRLQTKSKGAGASGLELMVEDAYNGKQRPVATLSGGESFMAALSLALGLSDVVQAYAGGIRLDTLFIDEGFGSLDPESLDLAINTLIDLQASGRMVGIISHVPELKERINIRLDVNTDRSGSTTEVILN
jgi:exonuclease SbcC